MHDASKNQSLKKSQHVCDNRTGCIAHTLVMTASGLFLGLDFEHANNDCTMTATERLIHTQQLAPVHGDCGPSNLTNTLLAIDHGYINPSLFYDFLIPSGAEIMRTCKRQPMFPFTFNQHLKPDDPPQDVPVK